MRERLSVDARAPSEEQQKPRSANTKEIHLSTLHGEWNAYLLELKNYINYGLNLMAPNLEEKRKTHERIKTVVDLFKMPKV